MTKERITLTLSQELISEIDSLRAPGESRSHLVEDLLKKALGKKEEIRQAREERLKARREYVQEEGGETYATPPP